MHSRQCGIIWSRDWGWRDEMRLDKVKRKYIKWILRLDKGTPNFLYLGGRDESKRTKNGNHEKSNQVLT